MAWRSEEEDAVCAVASFADENANDGKRLSLVRSSADDCQAPVPKTSPTITARVRQMLISSSWYHSSLACRLRTCVHSKRCVVIMSAALLLALVLTDIWIICGMNSNIEIDVILTCVFVVFAGEVIVMSAVDGGYIFSFFFFMDIIGTVSMIFDLSYMLGASNTEVRFGSADDGADSLLLARVARLARLSARLGRLTRLIKVIRLLPFFFNSQDQDEEQDDGEEPQGAFGRSCFASSISQDVANVLATRVACFVVVISMVIAVFDTLTFPQTDYALLAFVVRLGESLSDGDTVTFQRELDHMVEYFKSHSDCEGLPGITRCYGPYGACQGFSNGDGGSFTCTTPITAIWDPSVGTPPRSASSLQVHSKTFAVLFNMHQPLQTEAGISIFNTFFIIVIMLWGCVSLSNVLNKLAVLPLERVLLTIRRLATTIFRFRASEVEAEEDEYDKFDCSCELKMLERVLAKLAIIADLQTTRKTPAQSLEKMRAEDLGILNLLQGENAVQEAQKEECRRTSMKEGAIKIICMAPLVKIEDVGISKASFDSWDVNALSLDRPQTITLSLYVFSQFYGGTGCSFLPSQEDHQLLVRFVDGVLGAYPNNIFHSFFHGADVLFACARMMRCYNTSAFLNELEEFCILIAAVGHDVGHLGYNNGFLTEVSHELALKYNDCSPLENMHSATLFTILGNEETNLMKNLNREEFRDMRKMIIEMILHTDMIGHMPMVKELEGAYLLHEKVFNSDAGPRAEAEIFTQPEMKLLTMNCLLHSADVSNPCRSWELTVAWADRVLGEFFAQGDEEKRLGVPVQFLNNRDKLNRPNSQIGFVEFMIAPFFAAQIWLYPGLERLGDNLIVNIGKWEKMWQLGGNCELGGNLVTEPVPSPEDAAKVRVRIARIQDNLHIASTRGRVCI